MQTYFDFLRNLKAELPALAAGEPVRGEDLDTLLWQAWQAGVRATAERFRFLENERRADDRSPLGPPPLADTLALSDQLLSSLRNHQHS